MESHKNFIFEQTCLLLAGRLSNSEMMPTEYIKKFFEDTYKALEAEYKKDYVKRTTS